MTNIQTIIVLLWFVPALGFIVLPLLWLVCGVLYRAAERSRLGDISGFVALNNRDAAGVGEDEKRERSRIRLEKGAAYIDCESNCCRAQAADISKHGICLTNIPQKMSLESGSVRVLLRTRQRDYTLKARPIWKKITGTGYAIGAEFERIPAEWHDLVYGLRHSLRAVPG